MQNLRACALFIISCLKTLTLALAKVFASYIKFGAIPEHFYLSFKENIDELLMTQVLPQKSKRKVMNENQVLRAFF